MSSKLRRCATRSSRRRRRRWCGARRSQRTTIAPATGVRAVATHDTVTVTWDPQPAARAFWVSVDGPRGRGGDSASFSADGDAPHRVVFRHLPPGCEVGGAG